MDEMLQLAEIETATQVLLRNLIDELPGELGCVARSIIGTSDRSAWLHSSTPGTSDDHASSSPIPWASDVLALCCIAYGRPPALAVPVAACLELLGIVSSVLDTAQDNHHDRITEYAGYLPGRDSYNQQVKTAVVSNAGVALIGLAWKALLVHGPRYGVALPTTLEIGQMLADRWASICHAQHQDLTVGRATNLSLEEYEQIVAGKAGEIGGTACQAGAILAGAHKQQGLWHTLGTERTVAQQIGDDYKDLEHDLATGQQVSQAMLYGLTVADEHQRAILVNLHAETRRDGPDGISARRDLIQQLEELGAVHYGMACLSVHRQQALAALQALALPSSIHEWLQRWVLDSAPTYANPGRLASSSVGS
jgi:geranylgeranyl pyrophosphate synthase